jgi:hypothetical protein
VSVDALRQIASGDTITPGVLRDFLLNALRHEAILDVLGELIAHHAAGDSLEASALSASLPTLITEILDAATVEDWEIVAERLIDAGRDALGEGGGEA